MKRRFDEREEACANLARATEVARAENESRAKLKQAQSDKESSLRDEVFCGAIILVPIWEAYAVISGLSIGELCC